jgi:hypothetical protein
MYSFKCLARNLLPHSLHGVSLEILATNVGELSLSMRFTVAPDDLEEQSFNKREEGPEGKGKEKSKKPKCVKSKDA